MTMNDDELPEMDPALASLCDGWADPNGPAYQNPVVISLGVADKWPAPAPGAQPDMNKKPVVHYRLGPALLACRTPGANPNTHFPASEDRTEVTCQSCLRVTDATLARLRAVAKALEGRRS